jgi:hypothetical protein
MGLSRGQWLGALLMIFWEVRTVNVFFSFLGLSPYQQTDGSTLLAASGAELQAGIAWPWRRP